MRPVELGQGESQPLPLRSRLASAARPKRRERIGSVAELAREVGLARYAM